MKNIYLLAIAFFLTVPSIFGQQDPQYTQYMYNMNIINPAYTTNELGVLNLGALYRSQWSGVVGAPKTLTFFGHAPLSNRVEAGLSLVSDNIGDGIVKENNFYADFAYILPLGKKTNLSFGIKGGVTSLETNTEGIRFPETQIDQAFSRQISELFPNIGVGLFLHNNNYYVGFSTPNLLVSSHIENQNGVQTKGAEEVHLFLTSGYVYRYNTNLKIKPAVLFKAVKGSPISFDVTLNAMWNNNFEFGFAYRLNDGLSGMFNMQLLPSMRIGYAYDYVLSNIGNFDLGSHEVFVLFDFNLFKLSKGYDKSPRFY